MLESRNPEISAEALEQQVEEELARHQEPGGGEGEREAAPPGGSPINDPYAWGQLRETLQVAELNVNAGAQVTSMLHHRGLVRRVALLVGRITIYLGRVITIPQRNFNNSILHALRITLDGIRDMNRNTARLEQVVARLESELREKAAQVDYLKNGLAAQERRVTLLLDELRNQTLERPAVPGAAPTTLQETAPDGMLDSLYLAFEQKFRGSSEEIRQRLLEYLPLIREAGVGVPDREILDIGSGRGEWLEILRGEGLSARGVDCNQALAEECRARGLEVEVGDGIAFLRSLPDASLGAVTGFHLIEHLEFDRRVALFDECARVLKPGGIALFETPNPRNLLVGGCNFWADPTHIRPLYPETHQFLLEYRGFSRVDLLFLHPHEGAQRLPEEEAPQLASRLNELLSCARDYAIVGYKA
ncbi:MAG: hypothetical protein Kow0089_00630 [Desulfobulbaceae bacterium]